MKFSTRAEYGLRAIVNLAKCFPVKKNLKAVSLEENISAKYLEKLIGELRKKEIIKSFKGKKGGYVLARDPKDIKVGEIIEILEGPIAPMKCYDRICAKQNHCPSSAVWMKLGTQIQKTLNSIKLSDLI
jgi:Rrf2 family protein